MLDLHGLDPSPQSLQDVLRRGDTVAIHQGDEFLVKAHVEVGGFFGTEGVEGGGFDVRFGVACETQEVLHFLGLGRACHAETGEVIDHHAGVGVPLAHLVEERQGVGIDEGADAHLELGGGLPQRGHAGGAEPVGEVLLFAGADAKAAHALLHQAAHGGGHTVGVVIDNGDAAEDAGMGADHVEHVTVVRLVVAHLDEHDAVHAFRFAVGKELLWREARRAHVADSIATGERVLFHLRRPHVYMGVDPVPFRRGGQQGAAGQSGGGGGEERAAGRVHVFIS